MGGLLVAPVAPVIDFLFFLFWGFFFLFFFFSRGFLNHCTIYSPEATGNTMKLYRVYKTGWTVSQPWRGLQWMATCC